MQFFSCKIFSVALIFLLALPLVELSAQCTPFNTQIIPCGNLKVVLEPLNDITQFGYCAAYAPRCNRIQFAVFLEASQGMNGFCLNYNQMGITIGITATSFTFPPPLAPFTTTKVNKAGTLQCSSSFSLQNNMSVDENTNQVTYLMPDPVNGETAPPTLHFIGNKKQIGYIVVDLGFNESATATCTDFYYTYENANGNNVTCSQNLSMPVTETNGPGTSGTSSDLSINFGAADTGNPDFQLIPLTFNAATLLDVDHLDFGVILTPTQAMLMPELIVGDDPIPYTVTGPLTFPSGMPGVLKYYFHFKFKNVIIPSGITNPIKLKVNNPVFISCGGTVCPSFDNEGTIILNNINAGSCFVPSFGTPPTEACANFGTCPPTCSENFSINVSGDATISGNACQLKVLVGFDWTGADDFLDLQEFRFSLDFEGSPNTNITSIGGTAVTCPGSNSPIACGGPSNCYNINGKSLDFCFKQATGGPLRIKKMIGNNGSKNFIEIIFNANGCIDNMVLRRATMKKTGLNATACIMSNSYTPAFTKLCPPYVSGKLATEIGLELEEGSVMVTKINNPPCLPLTTLTSADGNYGFCLCSEGNFTITPEEDENHLNGVTTFDLVLMSKHILGIEPLTSPYKQIAADANKSGSITTFDIVVLRQLILGITQNILGNKSWRFVDKNFIFPNPNDPFLTAFPEVITATINSSNAPYTADFVAVKIGDMNNSAMRPSSGNYTLGLVGTGTRSGETFILALKAQGDLPLTALQAGFRFDTDALEYIGPAIGDKPGISTDAFHLNEPGSLRMVWLAPDPESDYLQSGETLCYLTFRAKRDLRGEAIGIELDNNVLRNEGYTLDNNIYNLTQEASADRQASIQASNGIKVECLPNPTAGLATLRLQSDTAQKGARVFLFDPAGVRVAYRELDLPKGMTELGLPELANLPAGAYAWQLMIGTTRAANGHVVKAKQ